MNTDGATLTPEPEQAMPETTQEPDAPHEDERVLAYLVGRFEAIGYDTESAEMLATAGVDWHRVAAWVAAGCPLETAERIAL